MKEKIENALYTDMSDKAYETLLNQYHGDTESIMTDIENGYLTTEIAESELPYLQYVDGVKTFTINTNTGELKEDVVDSLYKWCEIKWNDGSTEMQLFKLNTEVIDTEDEQIFFYVNGEEELKSLMNEGNGEDFIITKIL